MALTLTQLVTMTKQSLGNRASSTGITIDTTWYEDRVNSAYRRLCTFQGPVMAPGARQPQNRLLRFFELEDRVSHDITTAEADNFIVPNTTNVCYVMDVYDKTNNVPLNRESRRGVMGLDPDALGRPRMWTPAGQGGVPGYYVDRRPGVSGDNVSVYETVYKYPAALTGSASPVLPDAWHPAIWLGAVAEGAALLDWPEKAQEYEGRFVAFIAERKSPGEESGYSGLAGARRNIAVGR